jgi:hypothetical protein
MNSTILSFLGALACTGVTLPARGATPPSSASWLRTSAQSTDARPISIVSGTYGQNCGTAQGNATLELSRQCDGRRTCSYVLPPATRTATPACHRDFHAEWRCSDTEFHTANLSAGARSGDVLVLSCEKENGAGK